MTKSLLIHNGVFGDLLRAGQYASELSGRVYAVRRYSTLDGEDGSYRAFVVILGVPDGERIYVGVSSVNTFELKGVQS